MVARSSGRITAYKAKLYLSNMKVSAYQFRNVSDCLLARNTDVQWTSCQILKIAGCACAGNAGNVFSVAAGYSDPDMHHGTCVTHVPWCIPGSLTGGFLWSRWRGKRSRHSRRMRNPEFYVTGKRSTELNMCACEINMQNANLYKLQAIY